MERLLRHLSRFLSPRSPLCYHATDRQNCPWIGGIVHGCSSCGNAGMVHSASCYGQHARSKLKTINLYLSRYFSHTTSHRRKNHAILSLSHRQLCSAADKTVKYNPKIDSEVQELLKEISDDFAVAKQPSSATDLSDGMSSDSEINAESDSSDLSSENDTDHGTNDLKSSLNIVQPGRGRLNASASEVNAGLGDEYEGFNELTEEEEFEEIYERVHAVELKRGQTGVFDINEVVALLKDENATEICVLSVPPSLAYVEYIVIASGRSTRHLRAVAEYIKWISKRKRSSRDPFFQISGLDSPDWMAIDLGNIAVHLFLPGTREMYDLESLWALGEKYDEKCNTQDEEFAFLFNQQEAYRHEPSGVSGTDSSAVDSVQPRPQQNTYESHADTWHHPVDVQFPERHVTNKEHGK